MLAATPQGFEFGLDLGCGVLVPVRRSELCSVFTYRRHSGHRSSGVEDKPFEANGLVVTTSGRWHYRGSRDSGFVGRGTTVSGVNGRHFGCRHDPHMPDTNLVVAINPGALDGDEPVPFGAELVPFDAETPVRLALTKADAEDFESCIFELLDTYATVSGGLQSRPHGYLRMQRVKRFVERHAVEDISLQAIADVVHMSPFSLLRQFKSHAGVTPRDYIMHLRLNRAKNLLSNKGMPVGEVGREVGFRDQRYFSRWFSKSTGVSPSAYRAATSA